MWGSPLFVSAFGCIVQADPAGAAFQLAPVALGFHDGVDLALLDPVAIDEYAVSIEPYATYATSAEHTMKEAAVVIEQYDFSQYFYINNELYVTISDENFELIRQIITDFEKNYGEY